MNFRPKNEHELARLKDEELIAYAVAARDADRPEDFALAVGIFILGRERMVRAMVADKVPTQSVEDVVQEVLVSAIESLSRINGTVTGQFVNWLKQITAFRIADYHKSAGKHAGNESIDKDGDEDDWFTELASPDADRSGEVEVLMVLNEVLESYSAIHGRVVMLRIEGVPSIEVAEIVNDEFGPAGSEADSKNEMTSQNVDKIYSRFKKQMREALGLEDGK